MTESDNNTSSKKRKKSPLKVLLVIVITFGLVAIVVVPLASWLILGGTIRGAEFCPDDFSQREFSYRVSPITGKQTKGMTYTKSYVGISDFLISENYLTAAKKPKTWHLLWDNGVREVSAETEALILDNYLKQTDGSWNLYWMEWSNKNPEHAKIFWPVISRMAKDELYVNIPAVMESVRNPGNIDQFKSRLLLSVAAVYRERATEAKEMGNESFASALSEQAKQFTDDASNKSSNPVKLDDAAKAEVESGDQTN